jgi:hypothetical protein
MVNSKSRPVLTANGLKTIFITYHPRCCGAGRATAERRFLLFAKGVASLFQLDFAIFHVYNT